MKNLTNSFLLLCTILLLGCSSKEGLEFHSPDNNISVSIFTKENSSPGDNQLLYSVKFKGDKVLTECSIGLEFKNMDSFGKDIEIKEKQSNQVRSEWENKWGRNKKVENNYNEMILSLKEKREPNRKMDLIFRAYNNGVAFRYFIPEQESINSFEITSELTEFGFTNNHKVWATKYVGVYSDQENEFNEMKISEIDSVHLPLIVKVDEDKWLSITEANLTDWSGMHLRNYHKRLNTVSVSLAPRKDDPSIAVKSETPATSPWRLIMINDNPGKFLESNILSNLNEPCALKDVSWIKPGKSAWDWWWCDRYAPDADFKLGSNTETMKYFIDFASEMEWEYQLIDWQWYGEPFNPTEEFEWNPNLEADITTYTKNINIPELVEYAKSQNVKLFLWLEWNHANLQMEKAFPLYEKWGIAGVKIDFMAGEDQEMVNFYHRLVKLAAKHHLLVDFHGAYKPTGICRTYPNLITREGCLGNEYTKWSDRITPEHTITLAYTRGILGSMDFTPGAFVNVTEANFKTEEFTPFPMAMGTRCNQLAMMIVYESAFQVLCDSPFQYRKSPQGLDLLKQIPTTWDETKFIAGEMANFIVVGRRAGKDWYIGSMTDWDEREIDISLDFLGEGKYTATVWKDGDDANKNPTSLSREELDVENSTTLKIKLAKGGGNVIYARSKEQEN